MYHVALGAGSLIAVMLIVAVVLGWVLVRWDMAKRDRRK